MPTQYIRRDDIIAVTDESVSPAQRRLKSLRQLPCHKMEMYEACRREK